MLLPDNKQIVLSHVDLRYDDHLALSDVSIEIYRGDFALIVGPNGGGKTSLLRVILGLLRPDEGEVVFYRGGTVVPSLDIGYLPQKSRIDSRFPITVAEVVAMGLIGKKLSRKDSGLLLDDMLARGGVVRLCCDTDRRTFGRTVAAGFVRQGIDYKSRSIDSRRANLVCRPELRADDG